MEKGISFKKLVPVFLILLGIFLLNVPKTLEETVYVDYSQEEIKTIIQEIESEAITDQDKIFAVSEFIDKNIRYEIMGDRCFRQTASSVWKEKEGDCVSSSKLAAALLSGMNIPTEIAEGCVFNPEGRNAIRPFAIPINPFVKLPVGRSAGPHQGQLHSWVRAYDGVRWWTVETTAGVAFISTYEYDYGYDKFRFVDHADSDDLCLLRDADYAEWCLSY